MNPLSPSNCPECGTPLTAEAPSGLCPACLMHQAMLPTGGDPDGRAAGPPTVEAVAAAFPQWEVRGLIGRGGMGAVFEVRQPKLNRLAALKIIPAARAERDPAFAHRFEREGQLLARLHHPNIVTVHDSGRSGDFYFLLMEYVDGVNLRQAMRANRFSPDQALAVVPKICEALQYAHEEGVLHRDIKPENILLDSKGRVKLADFGIAKLMHESGADEAEVLSGMENPEAFTQPGSAPGTPRYMAPEQSAHPHEVDHRADIYSLGVVFYELLTGELPSAAFSPPSRLAAVDHRVDAIVRQALEKDRECRQDSADELRTQVETVAGGFSQGEISAAVAHLRRNFEYKSKRLVFGLPLIHVVSGRDPVTGRIREARGILAFGEKATGFFAFGGRARGVLAFGGMAIGVVSFGGISVGILSMGGLALACGLAVGGLAAGPFALGGMALGWNAVGGMSAGWNVSGGMAFGHFGVGGKVIATHVGSFRDALPDGLRWLIRLSPWVGLTTLFWIPPMLAGILVPAWAGKQTGADSSGGDVEGHPAAAAKSPPSWQRPLAMILLLAAVPFCGLSLYWLYQMSRESGGWNPSPAEAFWVIGSWAGALLLLVPGLILGWKSRRPAGTGGGRAAWWMWFPLFMIFPLIGLPVWQHLNATSAQRRAASLTKLAQARHIYELTQKRYEAGVSNYLQVIDARYEMETAEAAEDSERMLFARRKWAEERLKALEQQYQAGIVSELQVIDARYEMESAEAGDHPGKRISARRKWARDRIKSLEGRQQAGLESSIELEKTKLERDKAEVEWQSLQNGGR